MRKVVVAWHAISVKQKIAKLFFQRKYLYSWRDYVFRNNSITASFRRHIL